MTSENVPARHHKELSLAGSLHAVVRPNVFANGPFFAHNRFNANNLDHRRAVRVSRQYPKPLANAALHAFTPLFSLASNTK